MFGDVQCTLNGDDLFFYPHDARLNLAPPTDLAYADFHWCCKTPNPATCASVLPGGVCPSGPDEKGRDYIAGADFGNTIPRKDLRMGLPGAINYCCDLADPNDEFEYLCDGGAGQQRGQKIGDDLSSASLEDCKDSCGTTCGLIEYNWETGKCQLFKGNAVSPSKCGDAPHLQTWIHPAQVAKSTVPVEPLLPA